MSDHATRAADAHVHASYFRKPEAIHPRVVDMAAELEAARLDATTAQDERDQQRRDANKIARDLTACRSELASIALLMQERGRLPDVGGDNFALVAGAVTEYVLAMELAVIALNERWKDETVEMNRQMAELRRLRDMVPGEWDKCRDDLEHKLYEREEECRELCARIDRQAEQIGGLTNLLACDDDCHHAPMCVRWEHADDDGHGHYPCDCALLNIRCLHVCADCRAKRSAPVLVGAKARRAERQAKAKP